MAHITISDEAREFFQNFWPSWTAGGKLCIDADEPDEARAYLRAHMPELIALKLEDEERAATIAPIADAITAALGDADYIGMDPVDLGKPLAFRCTRYGAETSERPRRSAWWYDPISRTATKKSRKPNADALKLLTVEDTHRTGSRIPAECRISYDAEELAEMWIRHNRREIAAARKAAAAIYG